MNSGIKVLLVDDDEVIRIYFRDILWIHGLDQRYSLTTVDSIDKAKKIINDPESRPDIVFLDLVLPFEKEGRTMIGPEAGLDLLRWIKSSAELKYIKVIIFSGHTEKSLKSKAKELGADDYLVKGENMPRDIVDFIEQKLGAGKNSGK